jgi:pantetheine-phosphate adenylyltransferase
MRLGIYAGTFDPLTDGHVHVIAKASKLFDGNLIVAIGVNPAKKCEYSVGDRIRMLESIQDKCQFTIDMYHGFLATYAQEAGATHLIRGIRDSEDLHFEKKLHAVNLDINWDLDTIFIPCLPGQEKISSSMVKGLINYHGWDSLVREYVPEFSRERMVLKHLMKMEWMDLCSKLNRCSQSNYAIFDELYERYSEQGRYYHDLDHIWKSLPDILSFDDPIFTFAWWFHDSVYDPTKSDNEDRSADFSQNVAIRMGLSEEEIIRIARLISATKHNWIISDCGDGLQEIADIDLLSLASNEYYFAQNSANIRKEYSMYSDEEYRIGRLGFLENFSKRSKIYYTKAYADKEESARKNLAREIERLKS